MQCCKCQHIYAHAMAKDSRAVLLYRVIVMELAQALP